MKAIPYHIERTLRALDRGEKAAFTDVAPKIMAQMLKNLAMQGLVANKRAGKRGAPSYVITAAGRAALGDTPAPRVWPQYVPPKPLPTRPGSDAWKALPSVYAERES